MARLEQRRDGNVGDGIHDRARFGRRRESGHACGDVDGDSRRERAAALGARRRTHGDGAGVADLIRVPARAALVTQAA